MKRCPACQRTYTDDQNFCLDDGTTLISAPNEAYDASDAPTNYPYRSSSAPTEMMQGMPTSFGQGSGHTTPPPQRPPQLPPQQPQPFMSTPYPQKRSNAILWIVLGAVVLIGGIVTAVILANRPSTTVHGGDPNPTPSYTPTTAPTATPSSASWEPVNADGFTISMPGKPDHNTQSAPSAVGPIPIHLYTVQNGFEGYIAGYSEYPDSVWSSAKPEDLMDGAQNGAINNVQGQVTSQHPITINGNPGREIIGTSPAKNVGFTARIYLVKPRMYMILYTQYDKDKPMSADGKKFLESFQLSK